MAEQFPTRFCIYRGGTSKAVFVDRRDLPPLTGQALDEWILAVFGSPDRRQIDGLGGADALTSKFAVIGPSSRADADVDYTFFQVGVDEARVYSDLNCGNISAAVGPYAVDEGLVLAKEPQTVVRIHATNFGKIIEAKLEVKDGKAKVLGDQRIHGVPGSGAPVYLDLSDMSGAHTGTLLPTGNPIDTISIEGVGDIEMSVVDLANVVCYIEAETFGIEGTEDAVSLTNNVELINKLNKIRLSMAVRLGISKDADAARAKPPAMPWISLVSKPKAWIDYATGQLHEPIECDFSGRLFSRGKFHKTYPGTGSACAGIAALIKGSVVHRLRGMANQDDQPVRIGHPCGTLDVFSELATEGDGALVAKRASFVRTARRIADGTFYVAADRVRGWQCGASGLVA